MTGRAHTAAWLAIASGLLAGCRSRSEPPPPSVPISAPDDASPPPPAPVVWPELADLQQIEPRRVIKLPARADLPRFDVGGPALLDDLAVVSSSQFGFVAVDWRRGQLRWSKPAGEHVAPPLIIDRTIALIGDCTANSSVPDGDLTLGCLRMVDPDGRELSLIAIHGRSAQIEPFAGSPGHQDVWALDDGVIRWRRGDYAVDIELATGIASPGSPHPPPIVIRHGARSWELEHLDGHVVAFDRGYPRREAWRTQRQYSAMLTPVYLSDHAPMIRIANFGAFAGQPEMNLFDIDATGSLHGQVSFPVPGIGMLGFGADEIGDVAIAVRLDRSIEHDFIASYGASARLMWVYPLPVVPRADPVGIAHAVDSVIAFHDGDTLTVLPQVLGQSPHAAPTPFASENPTP